LQLHGNVILVEYVKVKAVVSPISLPVGSIVVKVTVPVRDGCVPQVTVAIYIFELELDRKYTI
jgi:hypothetical protein